MATKAKERFRTSIILDPDMKASLDKAAEAEASKTGKRFTTNQVIEKLVRAGLSRKAKGEKQNA